MQFYLIVFVVLLLLNLAAKSLGSIFGYGDAPRFVHFFHFSHEDNAPTLFSVWLIIQISIICFVISRYNIPDKKYWLSLSLIFIFLSVDEFVALHERLTPIFRSALSTSGFFRYAWIIPGGILTLLIGILFLGWLVRLPRNKIRLGFIFSAAIYLTGVLLLEGIGGWRVSIVGNHDIDIFYNLITTVEESFEMLGLIAFAYFAAKFLLAQSEGNRLEVRLVDE